MTTKAYVSNRFPFLKLGTLVEFSEGVFETDNAELQELVEKNDFYGVHIHPRDAQPPASPSSEAETAPEPLEVEDSTTPRVARGSRGSRG